MINCYEDALTYIHTRSRAGSQLGLERMRELMKRLGNPQDQLAYVHVAGTNGKGSVTAMTAEILKRSGYKTGRYVSPFILDFRERMCVDGQMISKEMLLDLIRRIEPVVTQMEQEGTAPTEFEVVTALAFCFFAKMECEIVCLEVGLGGRFDSTNIIKQPLCCAITSIGLDHTAILGDSITQIAEEKAGILKPACSVICGSSLSADALGVIYEQAAQKQCTVILPNKNQMQLKQLTLMGTDFIYAGKQYHTALIGVHQIENTVTVLEICKVLQSKGVFISKTAIQDGLMNVFFPARMQVLCKEPVILLDGGHNPQGISSLIQSLDALHIKKVHLVIGMMRDKDCSGVVKQLLEIAASVRCVPVSGMPRAMASEELSEIFQSFEPSVEILSINSLERALEDAKATCGKGEIVLVCGSLYLAERVLTAMEKE